MPINILMPALSPTMEKGNLARWLKKEGDAVKSGDVLAEIETDKATMEVEAVDEGTLGKVLVSAGTQDVAVNTPIGIILAEGEDASSISLQSSPAPQKQLADSQNVSQSSTPLSQASPSQGEARMREDASTRVFASPLAKRLARDKCLDLSGITGSGPHGRIIVRDLETARPTVQPAVSSKASSPAVALPPSDDKIKALFAADSYTEAPHDQMRKVIARRLSESKQTIPHFYLSMDCELDALLKLREQLNAAAPKEGEKPVYKLSVNDMVIKALALALKQIPDANVTWTENTMIRHKHVDVGVAVSIPGGLITPIVRDACHKSLSVISNEMKDFAARARARKLQPQEYQGGTTSLSNLGMYGVKQFAAIVNPPHATILSVGAGEQRAVVKNGALAIATVMTVTLSTDHRAVDGALAAELGQAIKNFIENPLAMLV